jgi:hypothetical protein
MPRLVLWSIAAISAAGCATNQAPKPVGDAASPHVGWVIMQGTLLDPDEEFVCQSNPRTPCELTASTPERQVFSDVHLYFHSIGTESRYEGTAEVTFLSQGRPMQLNEAVKPGAVGSHSVAGIVTDKPGEYALNIKASATTPAGPVQVIDRVPIVVK